MAFNLSKYLHSVALKEVAKSVLAAAKQIADEAALELASTTPVAAPVIAIAQPLADDFLNAVVARVQKLEDSQNAKEKVAAVAEVSETPPVK